MGKIKKNGFFVRLLAVWIDALLIFFVLKLFFYLCLALPIYLYFPFEFTFIVTFIIYSAVCMVFKCNTLGRYLLNMSPKMTKYIAAISFIIFVVYHVGNIVYLCIEAQQMRMSSTVTYPFENRDANHLKEVTSISEQDYSTLSDWVEDNKQSPEEYVIQIAKNYKVTLIGERHHIKTYTDFFNDIIPNLYHKAGVRCIAMEVIPSSMNGKIEKLIDADEFDERLFMEISRSQPWCMWGLEEYWNVLKNAWKLNKNLKSDEQKLRVVGIDSDWIGPKFALVFSGTEDGVKNVPFVEKFRVFTLIPDFIKIIQRDEIMARNIEKEAIEKNDKCVVLVGYSHTFLNFGSRMGAMLNKKYKNDIFQIVTHHNDCISDDLLNKVIYEKGLAPIGFTVENSPFAMFRDSTSYIYANLPKVSFSDVAQGYIYMKPFDKIEKCKWMSNYISKEMFMKYKPYYERRLNQKFNNEEEMNDYMPQYFQ